MPSAIIATLWLAAGFVWLWVALNGSSWLAWGAFLLCAGVGLWHLSGAAAARAAQRVDRVRLALATGDAAALVIASRAGVSIGSVYAVMPVLERDGEVVSHLPKQSDVPGLPPRRLYALTSLGVLRAGQRPVATRPRWGRP